MKINATNTSSNALPAPATAGSAGLDLRAKGSATIKPRERCAIPTGLSVAIPEGYVGLIWPRSGLAVRAGIDVLAGVIDADYRGELGVVLVNHGGDPFDVQSGDRIAQLLIQPVVQAELVAVDSLEDTERGRGGFGSTGAA